TLVPKVIALLREQGMVDVKVLVGGIIPEEDADELRRFGVAAIFGPGTETEEIVRFTRSCARSA
ncbi:cobalamin B12-binding domain protein, partial [mine drainage metagenome]